MPLKSLYWWNLHVLPGPANCSVSAVSQRSNVLSWPVDKPFCWSHNVTYNYRSPPTQDQPKSLSSSLSCMLWLQWLSVCPWPAANFLSDQWSIISHKLGSSCLAITLWPSTHDHHYWLITNVSSCMCTALLGCGTYPASSGLACVLSSCHEHESNILVKVLKS